MLQGVFDEAIKALASSRGRLCNAPMKLGRHPKRKRAGIRLLGLFATLPAPVLIIGDCIGEGGFKLIEGTALKGSTARVLITSPWKNPASGSSSIVAK